MEKTITVREALNKGRLKLVYLPILIITGFIGLGIILKENQLSGNWIFPLTLILGFVFGWIAWSYFVNKWKIWAFENVQNVHELKRKAIEEKLIWESGSWFEKTEFKSPEQKTKLKSLEKKFLTKDIYTDDNTVPIETKIYYSISTSIINTLIYVFSFGFIAYYVFENIWIIITVVGVGVLLTYNHFKKIIDRKPQLIINSLGIQLKDKKVIPWNKIRNDKVLYNYLVFNNTEIEIEYLNIKNDELENLLHVYRVRFENNNLK
ncbi:hypothetical protein C8C83_2906 [Flavobacterium sp. 90]|uniref:hypothetical protein n=1 Tax=unclassified Flavobacterium TaxID=196869 RepID=UPI000EB15012|nr:MULTISPECIES: hypothetical protein [unclassified Flavobacterium]RKR11206.1 hypothetical protein C8C82_3216 [Flavobacterium sp. 81]TCK54987.1 hypothetical protein C8C83_2906 [Flavobacterium sp. 90]